MEELKVLYPDGICSLEYKKDYELLFSVRLAAQCTDERVNKVTPDLYARFPTLEALAHMRLFLILKLVQSQLQTAEGLLSSQNAADFHRTAGGNSLPGSGNAHRPHEGGSPLPKQ